MKKIASLMTAIVILLASFVVAPAASAKTPAAPSKSTVLSLVPANIVVEQTATLSDGRTVTLYYKKSGNNCEVYSPDNLKGYEISDLAGLQSTSFRIVSSTKGNLVYQTTTGQAVKIVKRLVNTYL